MLQLFPDGPSKPQQNDPKSQKRLVKDPATGSLRDVLAVDRSDAIFPPEKIREMAERTKGKTYRIGGSAGIVASHGYWLLLIWGWVKTLVPSGT